MVPTAATVASVVVVSISISIVELDHMLLSALLIRISCC